MKLSLCLETLFTDRPFPERMRIASRLGYRAIEFWDWRDKDLAAIAETAAEEGLSIAAISGNRRHSLVDPDDRGGLVEEMMQVFDVARRLHCHRVMMLSDVLDADGSAASPSSLPAEKKIESMVEGLSELAKWARASGVMMLLEPLNTVLDHRGCFLNSSGVGLEIVRQVASPQVSLLYDIYHMSRMGEDVLAEIERNWPWIGHLHVADIPGRHQPGRGRIDYRAVIQLLKRIKYDGLVGMEFFPLGPDQAAAQAPLEIFA
jgi:hydroxypyruvate isomerase